MITTLSHRLTCAILAATMLSLTASLAQASIVTSGLSVHYRADNVDNLGNAGDGSTTSLVNLANPGTHDGSIVGGSGVTQNIGQTGTVYQYGVVLTGQDSTQSHISTSYQIGGGVNKVTSATWEFWLRADGGPSGGRGALYGEYPVSTNPRTRHYVRLDGIGTGTRTVFYDEFTPSGGSVLSDAQMFDDATFSQLVVTKSVDTLTFYRNGVQVGSTKTNAETWDSTGITQTLLGFRGNETEALEGQFSAIRIYDAVLTSAQVLQNFNAENTVVVPTPAALSAGLAMLALVTIRRNRK